MIDHKIPVVLLQTDNKTGKMTDMKQSYSGADSSTGKMTDYKIVMLWS